jgi:hypothetical protein
MLAHNLESYESNGYIPLPLYSTPVPVSNIRFRIISDVSTARDRMVDRFFVPARFFYEISSLILVGSCGGSSVLPVIRTNIFLLAN